MALGQKRNTALVPQAAQALEQLKNELASEISNGPDPQAQTLQSWYQTGYGGDVPSRVWGSVGGNMVRRMIAAAQQSMIQQATQQTDRKSTRLNSSHVKISYAVFCLKKKK